VGAELPSSVTVYPLPETMRVPAPQRYAYGMVNNNPVVVDKPENCKRRDEDNYDLGDGQWNIPKLRELLERILPNDGLVEGFEVRHDFPRLGTRVMMLNARRIEPEPGRQLILLHIEDATGKKMN